MFQIVKPAELPVSFTLAAIQVPVRDSLGPERCPDPSPHIRAPPW